MIVEKEKIDRINELGRIAKTRELTPEETEERRILREEYIKFLNQSDDTVKRALQILQKGESFPKAPETNNLEVANNG